MSMYLQLRSVMESSAAYKPFKIRAKNPEVKGNSIAVKMESAPVNATDAAIESAASKGGISFTETVPLGMGVSETRPTETVAGDKAIQALRAFRQCATLQTEELETASA